jgi:excisionase family DNA binding protein
MPTEMPAVMTVKEVAAHFQVHPSSIYRMLKAGSLPSFRCGSDWRFLRSEIAKWMMRQTGVPKALNPKTR